MNEITDLSRALEDYEYGKHVKGYLRDKLLSCGKGLKELILASGYARDNTEKFQKHCTGWHELLRPMPRKYLEAIGGAIEDIDQMLALDIKEFGVARDIPRLATGYIVKLMCAVYVRKNFKPALSEEAAIQRIKEDESDRHRRCCINDYAELVTIAVEPDGSVNKHFYEPRYKLTKTLITFGGHGGQVGRSYIRNRAIPWTTFLSLGQLTGAGI